MTFIICLNDFLFRFICTLAQAQKSEEGRISVRIYPNYWYGYDVVEKLSTNPQSWYDEEWFCNNIVCLVLIVIWIINSLMRLCLIFFIILNTSKCNFSIHEGKHETRDSRVKKNRNKKIKRELKSTWFFIFWRLVYEIYVKLITCTLTWINSLNHTSNAYQ